jgi:hypothetical protein
MKISKFELIHIYSGGLFSLCVREVPTVNTPCVIVSPSVPALELHLDIDNINEITGWFSIQSYAKHTLYSKSKGIPVKGRGGL